MGMAGLRAEMPLAFSRENGAWLIAPPAPPSPPVDLSLVTWNVWFGGHAFDQRGQGLLAALMERRPDVVVLQEVTPELLATLVKKDWVRENYQISDATGRTLGDYGILLLSRLPVLHLGFLELPSTMGRVLLVADLACGLTVAAVHLESMGHSASVRAAQLALIQSALANAPDMVLAGDMNFTPDDAEENAVLDRKLVDLWPALQPDEPGYTVDSTMNTMRGQVKSKSKHERIDRIFLRSDRWRARSIQLVGTSAIEGGNVFVSDHFGLSVELSAK